MPSWTREGAILFSRKLPGTKVPWEYQPQRPDTDHFNRDFKPELARGGTEICRLDSSSGLVSRLTRHEPPVWDFRVAVSPDGGKILFCRAATGEAPGIWLMDHDGENARLLTKGWEEKGADHPRWVGR